MMRAHGLQYAFWKFIDRDRRIRAETERLLEQVRLTAKAGAIAGELAYSEQRSLEIAMTLASDPRIILLDEPMAGMSHEETAYTSELIREATAGRTLMIVEHDMDVVFFLERPHQCAGLRAGGGDRRAGRDPRERRRARSLSRRRGERMSQMDTALLEVENLHAHYGKKAMSCMAWI